MNYEMVSLEKDMLPALAMLEKECFSVPWTENMFAGELGNPAAVYRIIRLGSDLVAYMGMWIVADEGQITNVAVSPLHRRKGLASWLIEAFISIGKGAALSSLTLEVREGNRGAIALYEGFGFQQVGRRKNYYEGKEDALLMTLFLTEGV